MYCKKIEKTFHPTIIWDLINQRWEGRYLQGSSILVYVMGYQYKNGYTMEQMESMFNKHLGSVWKKKTWVGVD